MADTTPSVPPSEPSNTWLAFIKRLLPTNWKSIVIWAVVALTTVVLNRCQPDNPDPIPDPPIPIFPDGWLRPTDELTREVLQLANVAVFADTEAGGMLLDDSDDAPLYRFYAKLHGKPLPSRNQGEVGSCGGFGFAGAVENALATQAVLQRGPLQQPVPDVSQEVIYAGSRVDAHGGRSPFNGDGTNGASVVKWLSTGGVLARGKYGDIDLTEYSVEKCKTWGDRGVPRELKPEAKKNLCTYALVRTASDARKAIHQGYPIAVCSDQGFANKRDAEGYAAAQGTWYHCMYIAGYRATPKKGFLIVNSWGPNWISGPKGTFADIPDGSFWAEEKVVDRMLSQGDSYAISGVGGFKRDKILPNDWIVVKPSTFPDNRRRFHHGMFATAP